MAIAQPETAAHGKGGYVVAIIAIICFFAYDAPLYLYQTGFGPYRDARIAMVQALKKQTDPKPFAKDLHGKDIAGNMLRRFRVMFSIYQFRDLHSGIKPGSVCGKVIDPDGAMASFSYDAGKAWNLSSRVSYTPDFTFTSQEEYANCGVVAPGNLPHGFLRKFTPDNARANPFITPGKRDDYDTLKNIALHPRMMPGQLNPQPENKPNPFHFSSQKTNGQ